MDTEPEVKKREYPLKRGSLYYIQHNGSELALPAVTTILGDSFPKKQLIHWAARTAAEYALANPWSSVEEASGSIYKVKTAAADKGKSVHSWAEAMGNGIHLDPNTVPEALRPYCQAFVQFMANEQPRIMFTECVVFNTTHGYAGTVDQIGYTKDGKLAIFDYKTGKETYWEAHLQQEAYAHAEYLMTKEREIIPMPKIEAKYLVHLKPNATYSLIGVEEPLAHFLAFKNVYEILKTH